MGSRSASDAVLELSCSLPHVDATHDEYSRSRGILYHFRLITTFKGRPVDRHQPGDGDSKQEQNNL